MDDPRLGDVVERWAGDESALRAGRPILVGFPQDEGVRRNGGRVGAARGPGAIRHWLHKLVAVDPQSGGDLSGLLDLGDASAMPDLEASQSALGTILAALLTRGCVPIVLGGGHETALGTYEGYVRSRRDVSVINVDAHLDVRPLIDGLGHSGSPFRQMFEHPTSPLPGERYACLGAQPANTSRQHADYVRERGGEIVWADDACGRLAAHFERVVERMRTPIHVSLDADVVRAADVPGVSAPAALGLCAAEVAALARLAGARASSFEVVEINPTYDVDGRSARWAAVVVWAFVAGLASREGVDVRQASMLR